MLIHNSIKKEELSYESILENWERSRYDFMLWLSEVCGVGDMLYNEINKLIKNDIDLNNWISCFDGDFDKIEETTELYKESILQNT